MKLIDDHGEPWTILFMGGQALVRQVDSAACEMIRCRHTRPVLVVMTLAELERALMEQGAGLRGSYPTGYSIAGIQVEIKDERYEGDHWYDEWTRHLAIDPARPGSDRAVVYSGGRGGGKAFVTNEMIGLAMAVMRDATAADDVYRRHGGKKRPPSKLHPLVQLDEAIGRDLTRGDE